MKRIFLLSISLCALTAFGQVMGPDRAFENVTGPVKSIITSAYYDFSPDGGIPASEPDVTWKTEFDSEGYYLEIEEVTRDDNDFITVIMPSNPAYCIVVDWENGRVVRRHNPNTLFDGSFKCDYTYDSQGRVIKEVNTGSEAGDFTITYEYLGADNRGNWTKRIANTVFADCYEDDEEEPCNQQQLQVRKIIYY